MVALVVGTVIVCSGLTISDQGGIKEDAVAFNNDHFFLFFGKIK